MDPFVASALNQEASKLVPDECKEFDRVSDRGPVLKGQIEDERTMTYSCNQADNKDAVCQRCPVFRGREISI